VGIFTTCSPTVITQGQAAATTKAKDPSQQAQVIADFKSCPGFSFGSEMDTENFLDTLAGNIDGVVQYNLDEFHGKNPTIQSMCDVIHAEASDPYTAYVKLQA
jgi:hypothetical protein